MNARNLGLEILKEKKKKKTQNMTRLFKTLKQVTTKEVVEMCLA